MASPRTRKIRKLKAAALRAAAAQPSVAAPTPEAAPEPKATPAPEPVVIEMAPEEDVVVVSSVDYSSMTKAELVEILNARGVEYSRYSTKAELVELAEG